MLKGSYPEAFPLSLKLQTPSKLIKPVELKSFDLMSNNPERTNSDDKSRLVEEILTSKALHRQLSHADLSQTNLRQAYLIGAHLREADLCDARLTEADLCDANLERASLIQAKLDRINLTRANLHEADLSGAYILAGNLKAISKRSPQAQLR